MRGHVWLISVMGSNHPKVPETFDPIRLPVVCGGKDQLDTFLP